jgi:hypothetical protein
LPGTLLFTISIIISLIFYILFFSSLIFTCYELKILLRMTKKNALIRDNIVVFKKFKSIIYFMLLIFVIYLGNTFSVILIFNYSIVFYIIFFFTTFIQISAWFHFINSSSIHIHKFNITELRSRKPKIDRISIIVLIAYSIIYLYVVVHVIF